MGERSLCFNFAQLKEFREADAFHFPHLLESVADEDPIFPFQGAHIGDGPRATRSR